PCPSLGLPDTGLLDGLVGAEVDFLPLVVEISTLPDVVEVKEGSRSVVPIGPARRATLLLRTPDSQAPLTARALEVFLSVQVTAVADERLYLLQGRTVLHVVHRQLALPLLGVTGLPPLPPSDALQPRCIRLGPRAAQTASHILQAVGV